MHITIDDYVSSHLDKRPREVSFHAAPYFDGNGQQQAIKVAVRLPTGEAGKLIKRIRLRGGIGGTDENGILRFVPWPPAVIEVRDL